MQKTHSDYSGTIVPFTETDFIPLPAKSVSYRGIVFSRSTLLRMREQGRIKLASFRFTGAVKPRLYILTESLDAFIAKQLATP